MSVRLAKCSGEWSAWFTLQADISYIRFLQKKIPSSYLLYDPAALAWRIHSRYIHHVQVSGPVDILAVLHLRPTAPKAIIKAAWRVVVQDLHPDKGGDPAYFVRAQEAYEQLMKE